MGLLLKKLSKDDAVEFCKIRIESIIENPHVYRNTAEEISNVSYAIAERLLEQVSNLVVGVFDGSQLIGVRGFSVYNLTKLGHKGFLWGLFVKDSYRGRGLGKKMTEWTIEHISKNFPYIEQIRAGVVTTNVPNQRILYSLGFEKLWTEKQAFKYNGKYHDLHHFVKFIKNFQPS